MSKFLPATLNGRTVGVAKSVSTTSANYALSGLGVIAPTLRVANTGAAGVFFALDSVAVTATTNDIFITAGTTLLIDIPASIQQSPNIGYITASGVSGISLTFGTERN